MDPRKRGHRCRHTESLIGTPGGCGREGKSAASKPGCEALVRQAHRCDPDRILDRKLFFALKTGPQALSGNKGHGEPQEPAARWRGFAGIEDAQDVRVLQPGGKPYATVAQLALDAIPVGETLLELVGGECHCRALLWDA